MIGTIEELKFQMSLLDDTKIYELNEYKKKRSLDANNYYWQLLSKIANVLGTSKGDLHISMLKRYGQITAVCVPSDYKIERFIKYFEYDGKIQKNGKNFYVYKVFLPSSEMNTQEMSVLIDGVVSEAKELGIETLPPDEIKRLKESW